MDTKKIDDISTVTVSSKVLAEIISVGDRQIRNLANEGILVRNTHGRYLLMKSLKIISLTLKLPRQEKKFQVILMKVNLT